MTAALAATMMTTTAPAQTADVMVESKTVVLYYTWENCSVIKTESTSGILPDTYFLHCEDKYPSNLDYYIEITDTTIKVDRGFVYEVRDNCYMHMFREHSGLIDFDMSCINIIDDPVSR